MRTAGLFAAMIAALAIQQAALAAPQSPEPEQDTGSSQKQMNLPSFTSVVACAPFNILLAPSTGNSTGANFSAEQEVIDAVDLRVANSTLYINANDSFSTHEPIRLTITMPPKSLKALTRSGPGSVVLEPGMSGDGLRIEGRGGASFYGKDVGAGALDVRLSGASTAVIGGNFSSATIKLDGASRAIVMGGVRDADLEASGASYVGIQDAEILDARVKLMGASLAHLSAAFDTVDLDISGASKLIVHAGSDDLEIRGTSAALSRAVYDGGDCNIDNQGFFDFDSPFLDKMSRHWLPSVCQKVRDAEDLVPDTPSIRMEWTCGIDFEGATSCGRQPDRRQRSGAGRQQPVGGFSSAGGAGAGGGGGSGSGSGSGSASAAASGSGGPPADSPESMQAFSRPDAWSDAWSDAGSDDAGDQPLVTVSVGGVAPSGWQASAWSRRSCRRDRSELEMLP